MEQKMLNLSITEEQYAYLAARAKREGQTLAAIVRFLIKQAMGER